MRRRRWALALALQLALWVADRTPSESADDILRQVVGDLDEALGIEEL
jgi:hypothetical protein